MYFQKKRARETSAPILYFSSEHVISVYHILTSIFIFSIVKNFQQTSLFDFLKDYINISAK